MSAGLNNDKIQRVNRSLVLRMILTHKMISRIELAQLTGLRKATITNVINEFLELGLVEECRMPKVVGRRTPEGLRIRNVLSKIISARIIREFVSVGIYTLSGELIYENRSLISTDDEIHITLNKMYALIDDAISKYDFREFLGMCVGVPGPYVRNGRNTAVVVGFYNLQEVDIQIELEKRYKDFPVFTEHDAKLSALAEWNVMNYADQQNCTCLLGIQSIGIGIGAGFVMNGRILHGAYNIAGDIGQMGINFNGSQNISGMRGTLETYASSASVKKYVKQRLLEFPESRLTEKSSFEEILEDYYSGSPLAVWAFDAVAWKLAYGLVNILYTVSPDRVVLTENYPRSNHFINAVQDHMKQMVSNELFNNVNVCYSKIEKDPTLLGGYYYVLDKFFRDSSLFDRIRAVVTVN